MKSNKNKIYLYYSIIFFVAAPLAFYVFLRDEKSFVWKSDAVPLYISTLKNLGRVIRQSVRELFTTGKIRIPMYDFQIGFGMDCFTFLRYEPFNFLSIFVDATNRTLVVWGTLCFQAGKSSEELAPKNG